jgi:16S rRNA (adenine1518-N6/adenine1519-N6)-dimethyltransferase
MPQSTLTKRQMVRLLADAGLRPAKRRGQSFLIDGNLLRLIADAPALTRDDVVLEVGTGLGQLTGLLAERAGHVVTVEVDRGLAGVVRPLLADLPNADLVEVDALATPRTLNPAVLEAVHQRLSEVPGRRFRVVANPPYTIATPLLLALLFGDPVPVDLHLTIQSELAARLASPPGPKEYGATTVMVQALAAVTVVHPVPRTAFWPPPRVDSALVAVVPVPERRARIRDLEAFRRTITVLFQSRRKTLRNALARLVEPAAVPGLLARTGIDAHLRPEAIPVSALIDLANSVTQAGA